MHCIRALLVAGIALAASAGTAAAQLRVLQDGDLELRAAAARRLDAALRIAPGDATFDGLAAAASRAAEELPEGSRARARLVHAIAAARAAAAPGGAGGDRSAQAALAALRGEFEDVLDDLQFEPVREAELPAGFPGYRAVGEIELRCHPAYRMVQTSARGGEMGSFWTLFRHIESNAIAMTAPVQIDWQGASDAAPRMVTMAFLYGSPELGTPGRDGRVEVVDVAPATVLSIGARGRDSRARVEELRDVLVEWLQANPGWVAAGPLRTMGYNSPMVQGDRRYFEVQLPVRRDPARSV